MQTYSNLGISTLNGGISAGAVSLTVNDGSVFPSSGTFMLLVEQEILWCTARTGNTLTVTRGQEGTTAASHASAVQVTCVITAGALDAFRADINQAGTFANKLAAAQAGRVYSATDGLYAVRDTGAALQYFGNLWKVTPPVLGDFSWINQGGATIDDTTGPHILSVPDSSGVGDSLRLRLATPPATPYTLTVGVLASIYPANVSFIGIGFRESSTGKLETMHLVYSTGAKLECNKWTNTTTYSATRTSINTQDVGQEIRFLRLSHDGTTLHFSWSCDGFNFQELTSFAKANFFTTGPDGVFFFGNSTNGHSAQGLIYHWAFS